MVKSAVLLPLLVMCGALPSARAAESGDFSEAFRLLGELGVPDTSGAVWVKAPKEWRQQTFTNNYPFSQLKADLRGDGWKIADGRFVDFGGITSRPMIEAEPEPEAPGKFRSLLGKMLQKHQEQNPDSKPPTPKKPPSLLEKDLPELLKSLADDEIRENIGHSLEYGRSELPGRVLIFAAQLHAAGHPEEAGKLAGALFSCTTDPTGLIDAAVNEVANARYQTLAEAFFENYDWKTYHAGLEELLAAFPRGWEARFAVAKLVAPAADRASGRDVSEPAIEGMEFPAAALEAIASWMSPPEASDGDEPNLPEGVELSDLPPAVRARILREFGDRGMWSAVQSNWLLPSVDSGDAAPASEDFFGGLIRLGMESLPALAALIGDETLTVLRNPGSDSGYHRSSSDSVAERTRHLYNEMARPMSRGEVATRLIAPVIPAPDDDFTDANSDPATLRDLALAFWRKHHNSSPTELCLAYLTDGTDTQRTQAARVLASSDDPEQRTQFEQWALANDPLEVTALVEFYLSRQQVEAREFFDRYATRFREEYGGLSKEQLEDIPRSWHFQQSGGVEGFLKKIGVHVGASSVAELIADAVSESGDDDEAFSELAAAIANLPGKDLLMPLAKAIPGCEGRKRARLFETFVQRLARSGVFEADSLPADFSTIWGSLLQDDTPLEVDDTTVWLNYYEGRSIATAAALALEFVYNADAGTDLNAQAAVGDEPVGELVLQRAKARFDSQDLPDFASAAKVPDDRKKEIAEIAAKADSPLDLRTRVLSLPQDERAAWIEWMGNLGQTGETPPRSILDSRLTVTAVVRQKDDRHPDLETGVIEELPIEPGTMLDPEILERSVLTMLDHAEGWSGVHLVIGPNKTPLGLEAAANRPEPNDWLRHLAQDPLVSESDAEAFAAVAIANTGNTIVWARKDGQTFPLTKKDGDTFPAFQQLVEFTEGEQLYFPYFNLVVLSREDAGKITNEGLLSPLPE